VSEQWWHSVVQSTQSHYLLQSTHENVFFFLFICEDKIICTRLFNNRFEMNRNFILNDFGQSAVGSGSVRRLGLYDLRYRHSLNAIPAEALLIPPRSGLLADYLSR